MPSISAARVISGLSAVACSTLIQTPAIAASLPRSLRPLFLDVLRKLRLLCLGQLTPYQAALGRAVSGEPDPHVMPGPAAQARAIEVVAEAAGAARACHAATNSSSACVGASRSGCELSNVTLQLRRGSWISRPASSSARTRPHADEWRIPARTAISARVRPTDGAVLSARITLRS